MDRTMNYAERAQALRAETVAHRRYFHTNAEVGLNMPKAQAYVLETLRALGIACQPCGHGVSATIGSGGKVILLRADMDALPMPEESGEPFACPTGTEAHACGHDFHAAMLLTAAKMLKENEDSLQGTVKLMFQPAEETFEGAKDMIANGILENPPVDAALAYHVTSGQMPLGLYMYNATGAMMFSVDGFRITIYGQGGHGAYPHTAVDPINIGVHIHLALQEINSRELDPHGFGVFTTGRFEGGKTSNVIPDTAEMWGTIRTVDPDGKINAQIKTRMTEIAKGVGAAMRCEVETEFYDFCPCMVNDDALSADTLRYMTELLGPAALDMAKLTGGKPGGGSEDFAFVSHKVPTVGMLLSTGNAKEGYCYTQHNPKAKFDDSVLFRGSAAYVYAAARWLEEHQ